MSTSSICQQLFAYKNNVLYHTGHVEILPPCVIVIAGKPVFTLRDLLPVSTSRLGLREALLPLDWFWGSFSQDAWVFTAADSTTAMREQ